MSKRWESYLADTEKNVDELRFFRRSLQQLIEMIENLRNGVSLTTMRSGYQLTVSACQRLGHGGNQSCYKAGREYKALDSCDRCMMYQAFPPASFTEYCQLYLPLSLGTVSCQAVILLCTLIITNQIIRLYSAWPSCRKALHGWLMP